MSNLEQIRSLSPKERRALSYDELVTLIRNMTSDEIMEVSKLIGYPVFARLCMGELKHKFVLLQDGAAAIILNSQNQILLQRRSDSGKWGLPGGCQELGERFQDTIVREIKEETNLDVEIDANKRYTMEYVTDKGKLKQVVLFIAKCIGGEIKAQECEVNDIKWLDFDEAIETITYDNTRELFKEILKERKK